MKRRTLLATVGSATLAGTAGCYGVAALINRGNSGDEQGGETNTSENATGDAQTNENNQTSGDTNESATDQERNESPESNESSDGEGEADENGNESDQERPADPVDTITVTDHGLDISESPEPDVDREIHCYCTFEVGEYNLADVRIDAVALADDGTRLDHGWVPFAQVNAGESYDVDIPFYVNPDEIEEYLIGATEATYVD